MEYGQALLYLVKAVERIPHHILVREAAALGYPGWLIRLAVATYRLRRALRVGKAVSQSVIAICGVTAGSGTATAGMRLMMIRMMDRALLVHPSMQPTLFVDDLAAECSGGACFYY